MKIKHRVKKLRKNLAPNHALLLARPPDIRYFSGYDQFLLPDEREGFCLISHHSITVFYPSMSHFTKRSGIEYQAAIFPNHLARIIKDSQNQQGWQKLLIDEGSLFLSEYRQLVEAIGDTNILAFDRQLIWQQRMIKSQAELAQASEAIAITQKVQRYAKKLLRPNISEQEVKDLIEKQMKKLGGWPRAFPTIVAFAENSALPHHQAGPKKLKKEMAVLIDCGATVEGYCGDMTRSFWFGDNPPIEYQKIARLVKKAFKATAKLVKNRGRHKPAVTAARLDQTARKIINEGGYGPNFIHTTGHGLGLSIHEPPSLNSQNQQLIKKGMVIAIEPGIYLEGKFGVRHEENFIID